MLFIQPRTLFLLLFCTSFAQENLCKDLSLDLHSNVTEENFSDLKRVCTTHTHTHTQVGKTILPPCTVVSPLPMGDISQDPQWVSETTYSTDSYIYYVFAILMGR